MIIAFFLKKVKEKVVFSNQTLKNKLFTTIHRTNRYTNINDQRPLSRFISQRKRKHLTL